MFNLGLVVILLLAGFAIGAFCWTYAINEWLVYFDKEPVIQWWQGGLIGLVPGVGHVGLVAAIFTWVLMLFLL